jgi:hypothetical protein
MNKEEAMLVALDHESSLSRKMFAVNIIVHDQNSTLEDLIRCLAIQGSPAVAAAIELHRRTGKPQGETIETRFETNPDEWMHYLENNNLDSNSYKGS